MQQHNIFLFLISMIKLIKHRKILFSHAANMVTFYRRGAAVSAVFSGSEEREFEPHSGSGKVTLFPPSVYHHYGDSYDGGRINL